jgi:hypothetical protein
MQIDFDIITYLRMYGTPVSSAFLKQIYPNETAGCDLGMERETKKRDNKASSDEDRPIQNLANQARRSQDFINITEYSGDIRDYLNPANKWSLMALVVPNRNSYNDFTPLQKQDFNATLKELHSVGTPEEGDVKLMEFVKKYVPAINVQDIPNNKHYFQCMFFGIKLFEDRFHHSLNLLKTPFYEQMKEYLPTKPAEEESTPAVTIAPVVTIAVTDEVMPDAATTVLPLPDTIENATTGSLKHKRHDDDTADEQKKAKKQKRSASATTDQARVSKSSTSKK